jgi:PhnB protein
MAQAIPEGMNVPIPHFAVKDANAFLKFLGDAFGAATLHTMPSPDGKTIMHASAKLGDGVVFCADATDDGNITKGNTMVYFKDVDAIYKTATAAGAKTIVPVGDMFWGDRWGMIEDPFGNRWQIATHKEDVAPEEYPALMAAQMG